MGAYIDDRTKDDQTDDDLLTVSADEHGVVDERQRCKSQRQPQTSGLCAQHFKKNFLFLLS